MKHPSVLPPFAVKALLTFPLTERRYIALNTLVLFYTTFVQQPIARLTSNATLFFEGFHAIWYLKPVLLFTHPQVHSRL